MKKYFRINPHGKLEFSDTYDENMGFIGLSSDLKCVRCGLVRESIYEHQCGLTMTLLETQRQEALASLSKKGEIIKPCYKWPCHPNK